jgi:hypothetical protein
MTDVELRARKKKLNARLLLGQRRSKRIISGRTGSVAHVAESADGDAYAFVILIDCCEERGMLFVVLRDWHEERASQVYYRACEYRMCTNMSKYVFQCYCAWMTTTSASYRSRT